MNSSLQSLINSQIQKGGQRVAFRLGHEKITWSELDQASTRRLQDYRKAGVKPGDRILCKLPTSLELPIAVLTHLRGGFIHVPVAPTSSQTAVTHLIELTSPRCIIEEGIRTFHEISPSPALAVPDPAWILSTSGTTGMPKGVLHTHRSLLAGIGALTELWEWCPADHQILALPLFHVHGLGIGILGAMLRGVETTLLARFDTAQLCQAMARHKATLFMGVPTMYHQLLKLFEEDPLWSEHFHKARLCTAGSAALGAERLQRFEALTGQRILERYGMSETLITVSNPYRGDRRSGSMGVPLANVQTRIVDGELQVRGRALMAGYWNQPQVTQAAYSEDDWFRTGDQVEEDADGYLYHRGRRSIDWIKSGGWRIGTHELEEALLRDSRVEEVAVVGLPDEEWGEIVAAAIVCKGDAQQLLIELAHGIRQQFPRHQHIRRWLVVQQLPRNAMGKIQKAQLKHREEGWQRLKVPS